MFNLPVEPVEYEDLSSYRCVVRGYWDITPADDCSQTYFSNPQACKLGSEIKAWFAAGHQCLNDFGLIDAIVWQAQELMAAYGPYSAAGCAALPPIVDTDGMHYGANRAMIAQGLAQEYNFMPGKVGSFNQVRTDVKEYVYLLASRRDGSNMLIKCNTDELDFS